MSKISNAVKEMQADAELCKDEIVTNFMGGESYVINPLDTLKMVTASSIFGEPSYYRDSRNTRSGLYTIHKLLRGETVLSKEYELKKTEDIMEEIIDKALNYDFGATLEWASRLRNDFNMRLNPQVIMVRAAIHPKREEWTKNHPGMFSKYNEKVMYRADEPMSQMAYYLYINKGKKNNIPSIIKRSWAKKLNSLTRYTVAKYKNHEIGMINGVRLCHAHSDVLDELMKKGSIEVLDDSMTWERYISEHGSNKESWEYVIDSIFTKEFIE